MSGEDEKKGAEGNGDQKDSKSHPESVPWNEYVGIKEKFNRVEADLKGQVSSLEEKLKNAASPEELTKLREELDSTKSKLELTSGELNTIKEKSVSEKRGALTKAGVPEESLKEMSEKELDAAMVVLAMQKKPGPDIGGGGGATPLTGRPHDLAVQAYSGQK